MLESIVYKQWAIKMQQIGPFGNPKVEWTQNNQQKAKNGTKHFCQMEIAAKCWAEKVETEKKKKLKTFWHKTNVVWTMWLVDAPNKISKTDYQNRWTYRKRNEKYFSV